MKNYIKLRDWSLLFHHYVFIDVKDYLADNLFRRENVCVWFGHEYGKEDSCYKVIFCKIRKNDEAKFLKALGQLKNKMLLTGYRDYMDFCDCFFSGLAV